MGILQKDKRIASAPINLLPRSFVAQMLSDL